MAGAKVAVAARNEEKLALLVGEITAAGGEALPVKMDVADAEQIRSGFKQVLEKFGRLDILVNNAAITRDGLADANETRRLGSRPENQSHRRAPVHPASSSTMMRARAGRIINIASVVAKMGNAGQANYVAAKAGLIGLTKAIAMEIASRNITVNAVAPGFIETPMTDVLTDKVKEELKTRIPLGRMGVTTRRRRRNRFPGQRRSRLHHRPRSQRKRRNASDMSSIVDTIQRAANSRLKVDLAVTAVTRMNGLRKRIETLRR